MLKCEFCSGEIKLRGSNLASDTTVCARCDKELKLLMREEKKAREVVASKRKCRNCHFPLTPSRYFICEICEPPEMVQSEDMVLEKIECLEERILLSRLKKPIPMFGLKKCVDCKTEKDRTEFSPNTRNRRAGKDSHVEFCKECGRKRFKRQYQRSKQKMSQCKKVLQETNC